MGLVASIYIGFDVSYCRPTKENSFMLVNVLCHIYQLEVSISNCLTIPFLNPVGYVLSVFFSFLCNIMMIIIIASPYCIFALLTKIVLNVLLHHQKGKYKTPLSRAQNWGLRERGERDRKREGGESVCVSESE